MWKKYLQRIILLVIVILGVKTSVETFILNINSQSKDTAVVTAWDQRMLKLIDPIPFERGNVGYISMADIPGAVFDADDASGEYILTQYAVSPLILIRGTDQEWNILNLDAETYKKWIRTNANNFELVNSGGGMYLVHKVNK
jgi:hypothetical protein